MEIRKSPLDSKHSVLRATFADEAGWRMPQVYTSLEAEAEAVRERIGVADVSAAGKVIVKGEAAADLVAGALGVAPEMPGDVAAMATDAGEDGDIARLARDEFLVVTPAGAEERVAQHLEEQRIARELFVSVINQTSGLAGLIVAGPRCRDLLSKLCALPLDAASFADQHVAQSSVAKVHTIIVRNDLGAVPAFELYFERPYGEYVWESIVNAGQEFGITPFGQQTRALLRRASKDPEN